MLDLLTFAGGQVIIGIYQRLRKPQMQIEFHTFDLAKEITEEADNGLDPVKLR